MIFVSKGSKRLLSLLQKDVRFAFLEELDGVGDVFSGFVSSALLGLKVGATNLSACGNRANS
ncbi:MAG: hypothetical protein A2V87_05775 [Deltaproteobacteria bacterium RBG_16_58_17]|nr:MAG: hypothetical protein A2V87_05775 [Deltaproteobacteria bacterium RBG_16_58_17]